MISDENDVLLKPPFSVYETPFCDAMAADSKLISILVKN